jgi:ankyrin repeat protein
MASLDTVLEFAIKGNLAEVKSAVQQGFDILKTDDEGVNVLHLAALNGHTPLVEYILEINDSSKIVSARGGEQKSTPLYWATSQHHIDIACKLMAHGASPSDADSEGHDCLFLAAMAEDVKLVALFHAHGASVKSVDKEG